MQRLLLAALAAALCGNLRADVVTLDFEGLTDTEIVTTQLPGFTFSNAVALTAGFTLFELEFPPSSGVNVVSDNGGAITIIFDSLVSRFRALFTYNTALTLTAYDLFSNAVASGGSLFSSNAGLSGEFGSSTNEVLEVVFAGGIRSVTILGSNFGGSFTMDDAQVETLDLSTVPEPESLVLVVTACGLVLWLWRKRGGREGFPGLPSGRA